METQISHGDVLQWLDQAAAVLAGVRGKLRAPAFDPSQPDPALVSELCTVHEVIDYIGRHYVSAPGGTALHPAWTGTQRELLRARVDAIARLAQDVTGQLSPPLARAN